MNRIIFDTRLERARRRRIAPGFAPHRFLVDRCADDVMQRLSAINREFAVAVNLASWHGALMDAASSANGSLPGTHLLMDCDTTPAMLGSQTAHHCLIDNEALPFGNGTVDLFVSLLTLHHVNDLPGTLIQLRRALRPDGLLLAAMFGGETLTELRDALSQAELEVWGGVSPRVSPFIDVRDAGGLLQRAGFALPVVDSDVVTVTYASLPDLMHDLRGMGQTNLLADRSNRPLTKPVLQTCEEYYHDRYAAPNGRLNATFEILYLTGWCPHENQQKPLRPGTAKARLADALRTKEEKL